MERTTGMERRLRTSVPGRLRRSVNRRRRRDTPRVAVIGAGAGGLAMGAKLREAGIDSFTIYERSDGVGGTWHDNTYPGAQCDVPSHFYSFSFALNPDWSMTYADQPEIRAYLDACTDRLGLRPHLRSGSAVRELRWDDDAMVWRLHLDDGTPDGDDVSADVVVSALGMLNVPAYPDIAGLDEFAGPVFHSARWDHDVDLAGRRVAVIGTGASAIQFVPEIAPVVDRLHVFQRSAPWIMPKMLRPYTDGERRRFRHVPLAARRERWKHFWQFERNTSVHTADEATAQRTRWATKFLAHAVPDEELRARLTPDYPIGCKRLLLSNDYFPALSLPQVELVTDGIDRVTPTGVVTSDGHERDVDVIILGTGFRASDHLSGIDVYGRGGRSLHEDWSDGASAYLGIAVGGFPNFFILYGPNTNQGGNSIIFVLEAQVHHVMGAIRRITRRRRPLEVRRIVQERDARRVQRDMAGTLWLSGCSNYFTDRNGRVTTQYPHSALHYWARVRLLRPGAYRLLRRDGRTVARPSGGTAGRVRG